VRSYKTSARASAWMNLLPFLALGGLTAQTQAAWSPSVAKLVVEHSKTLTPENPETLSLLGAADRTSPPSGPVLDLRLRTPRAKLTVKGKLFGEIGASEWVVLVSGLFSSSDTPFMKHLAGAIAQQGYAVLLLPSPWSTAVTLDAQSLLWPGNVHEDGAFILDLTESALELTGSLTKVQRLHFAGVSNGAMIASILPRLARRPERHLPPLGHTTLFSPVLDVGPGLRYVDEQVAGINRTTECLSPVTSARIKLAYLRARSIEELSDFERGCAREIIAVEAYEKPFRKMLAALSLRERENVEPTSVIDYIENWANPGVSVDEDPESLLTERMDLAENEAQYSDFRIFLAKDDSLNRDANWDRFLSHRPADTALIPYGGHLGYFKDAWFWEGFVPAAFPELPRAIMNPEQ